MKLLFSLFLTVVCVHCIPLYEDGRGHYTEKRTSYTNGYSAALNLNLGGKVGYKDGIAVLETTNSIGPDFKHYNESVEKTFERPADVTPPPPNSGSINGPQNGMLSQPSNAWAMPNNPWAMQNNPWGMQNNPWTMQNGPWVTQYNPWARPNNQWGMPNSQWSMPNNPSGMPNNQWGMSNSQWSMPNNPWGMPNNQWGVPTNPSNIPYNEWGMPNNPSGMPNNQLGISNYPRGRSRHLRYGESNGALNDTPNEMPQQNSSYGELCGDWPCGGRREDNDSENKGSFGIGFTAKPIISGQSEHKHGNGNRPSNFPYNRYPPYGLNELSGRPRYQSDFPPHSFQSYCQNWVGQRLSNQPYYPPSRYPSFCPPQIIPIQRSAFGPQYGRPQYGTKYATPFGTAHQTPTVAPNDSPNRTANGTPVQTPVETGDGTPQRKLFVTPTGIQETPAQLADIAS